MSKRTKKKGEEGGGGGRKMRKEEGEEEEETEYSREKEIQKDIIKNYFKLGIVAQACNPSYPGG
jgi:hypothetical protein